MAVGPKDGDGAGEEHRTEVPYQVTRWSNTYSGAGGGMSSQWNWDDRPRSRGCTWVYEIVGKLKCPKADTRERQVGVVSRRVSNRPEPAALALLGIALAGLGFSRRKRALS